MILPDINVLLYAYNPSAPAHVTAKRWWEAALNSSELIGLPHEVIFGFIRIATHPNLGAAAVPLSKARAVVEGWLELPQVRVLVPADDHFKSVMKLMEQANASGRVLSDAVLAAHAMAHRATLCSNDSDFARFEGLDWRNPLRGT